VFGLKVIMKVSTNWSGRREAGKSYEDIPSDVAERWKENGIADIDEETDEDNGKGTDHYADKKAKELYEMCIAAGIETQEIEQSRIYCVA
jgi:hypothetical protein